MGGGNSRNTKSMEKRKNFKHDHRRFRRNFKYSESWPIMKLFHSMRDYSSSFSIRSTSTVLSKTKSDNEMFSDYEVDLIRKSWKQVFTDKEKFSMNVYLRIFECEPELKLFFSWHDIETDKLIFQPAFKRQAMAILNVIDKSVQCLENILDSYNYLHRLGKFHTKLRGYGFKPEHWHLFKLSILLSLAFAIETDHNKQELLESWNVLITFIIQTMKGGYEEGMKEVLENPH